MFRLTIIVVPNEGCNFRCTGCFEPDEQKQGLGIPLDIEKIKSAVNEIWAGPHGGSDLCLHGGEPTLIPRQQFKALLEFLYQFKGVINIVSNGSRIDDYMIELFKKYNVYIAISCDGPPNLNIHRGPDPSDPLVTAEYNRKLQDTIWKLRNQGIWVSIMCILHKDNVGTPEKIEELKAWILKLKEIGIIGGRLNIMYTDKKNLELTPQEALRAWIELYEFIKEHKLGWNPLREMQRNLLGFKLAPCVHNRCDLFATHTISVLPDGLIGNCDRTFANGIYLRSEMRGRSGRYEALQQTQCKECRYWFVCGAGCPLEGVNSDWRNKTRFCETFRGIYEYIENDLTGTLPGLKLVTDHGFEAPFKSLVDHYQPIARTGGILHSDGAHGDMPHGDSNHGDSTHSDDIHGDSTHGDLTHGDTSHGDSTHGDSTHGDTSHGDLPHGDSSHGDAPDWKKR